MRRHLKFGSQRFPLPANRAARIAFGVALLIGGVLGFLPVLGFWMIPLGLLVLSVDVPAVRRFRRRAEVRYGRWRQRRRADAARKRAMDARKEE
jgi:hypothetical protein